MQISAVVIHIRNLILLYYIQYCDIQEPDHKTINEWLHEHTPKLYLFYLKALVTLIQYISVYIIRIRQFGSSEDFVKYWSLEKVKVIQSTTNAIN